MRQFIAAFCLTLFAISISYACTCAGLPNSEAGIREVRDSSDLVFLGRIGELTYEDAVHRGKPYKRQIANVVVLDGFKGIEIGDNISLIDWGLLCGLPLRERETFLFFMLIPDDGTRPVITGCNNHLVDSPKDLVPSYIGHDTSRAEAALSILRRIS